MQFVVYDKARQEINQEEPTFLQAAPKPINGFKSYICPRCGNGSGRSGTGIAIDLAHSSEGRRYKCFKCGLSEDVIGLYSVAHNVQYPTAIRELVEFYNLSDGAAGGGAAAAAKQEVDYTAFYYQCNANLAKTDYHRGISMDTLNRFLVGYVEQWTHPKAPNAPKTPRLIIPTSKSSYLARDTRPVVPSNQQPYTKSKVGSVHIFNAKNLAKATRPVFVVEGELDALSIIDVGGDAIALGSTAMVKNLLALLKVSRPATPLILALDNDPAGVKACNELTAGLEQLDIPFYRVDITGQYKDANEMLQYDRAALKAAVESYSNLEQDAEQARQEAYTQNSAANHINDFLHGIAESAKTPCTSTGFRRLDNVLDGGLYAGLYTIGAISSLGKTTLVLQIADQIAQQGKDVLIFSLEMARSELMAKSISRHTLQQLLESGGDIRNAKTARGITAGHRYKQYSATERELINTAVTAYSQYAEHIYISEGIGDIGAQQIRDTVAQHVKYTGSAPIVVIDYLQILAPYSERYSDKQNTDKAVLELKRISRDYKTPVIGISSFNRASYKDAATMSAFKESGSIEYSSDVLIGLQLAGASDKDFNVDLAKRKNPREVELVILKNRNGRTGDTLDFKYYPMFNLYEELLEYV